jgi:hypothetical protein
MAKIEYLIHIYRKGSQPLRSLSALTDEEAIRMMRKLYVPGSVFWERFKDPADYLRARRQIETWLRSEFIARGAPRGHPIYLIYGWSKVAADRRRCVIGDNHEPSIPLALFQECDVSLPTRTA